MGFYISSKGRCCKRHEKAPLDFAQDNRRFSDRFGLTGVLAAIFCLGQRKDGLIERTSLKKTARM